MTFDLDPSAPNIFPSKYRQVAVSDEADDLDLRSEEALQAHYVGRDAYMRTRFILVRSQDEVALIEVASSPGAQLFSPITAMRVLAGPDECAYVLEPTVDVGIPSHIARVLDQVQGAKCAVVEGRYAHISFILNPEPLRINVLDIVPPGPSKLNDQLVRILDSAEDLPPIIVTVEEVDSGDLLRDESGGAIEVLLPCRGPGVEFPGLTVSYLDQRPPHREWTLLGCSRSSQIHRHFYDTDAPVVDTCPRRFLSGERDQQGITLTRCCQLQQGLEPIGRATLVPWGFLAARGSLCGRVSDPQRRI